MDSWNKGRIAGVVALLALLVLAVIPLSTISDFYDNIAAGKGPTDLTGPSLADAQELNRDELDSIILDRILTEQLEKDKAEAITLDAAIERRLDEEAKAEAIAQRQAMLEEAEAAENMRIRANQLVGPVIIFAIATATMLYTFRRKIVANFSPRWRGRSKEFRIWAFASVCWAIAVFFYVFLTDPYAELLYDYDMTIGQMMLHMFSIQMMLDMFSMMVIPPLFFVIPPLFFGGALFRRRIVANLSPRWRGRSKEFRIWAFASVCWAIAVFFYVFLADPYAESFSNDEMTIDQIILHIFGMMIIPSLFFGGAWFGYKRFVE